MNNRLNAKKSLLPVAMIVALFWLGPGLHAQNIASQKAYFESGTTEILAPAGDLVLDGWMKTSNVGDLMVGFSTECSLWTSTSTTATKGGGKSTSSAHAAVNATVKVDGNLAEPGQVVYCDREQIVSLTFGSSTVDVTDSITLELFQKTKEANHFNFYAQNVGSGLHHIEVFVDSIVEADPGAVNTASDTTRAAIGKRTLLVDEINNP